MSLLALQREMRAWLVHEDTDVAARFGERAVPGLSVYQNNYRVQLVGCLETTFAKTRAWLGDEAFLGAAATHIDRVPPSSWTLDAYGRDFPATLALIYSDDPEVAELAAIELALEEAFVGADATALTIADMSDIDWESAVLRLLPTLETLPAHTNAAALWSALAAEETPPLARLLNEPEGILFWSHSQQARFRTVDQVELQALMRVRAGATFEHLCAETAEIFGQDDTPTIAGQWLGRWISEGLIIAIETS